MTGIQVETPPFFEFYKQTVHRLHLKKKTRPISRSIINVSHVRVP